MRLNEIAPAPAGRAWLAVLAVLTMSALLARAVNLGGPALWTDEMYSFSIASGPLRPLLVEQDQTPPLFALLLHFWIMVAGSGDLALRVPSALAGTAAVPVTFFVARRYLDPAASFLAAGLIALSVYGVVVSQEARPYALFLLLAGTGMLTLQRFEERPDRGRAVAHGAVAVLLLYTHAYALLFVAAHTLYMLLRHGGDAAWRRRWLALQGFVAVAYAPWLPTLLASSQRVAGDFWLQPPGRMEALRTLSTLAGSWAGPYVAVPLLALAVWWTARATRGRLRDSGDRSSLLWLSIGLPVALPFILSYALPVYTPKYAIPASIPVVILAVVALRRLTVAWRPPAFAVVTGILLAISTGMVASYFVAGQPEDRKQDWRTAAALVEVAPASTAVVFNNGYCDSVSTAPMCAFGRYSGRTDLRLVPFFFEDHGMAPPVTNASVQQLGPLVAGAPEVWVVYTYGGSDNGLIAQELERLGYRYIEAWEPKNLVVQRFEAP